MNSKKVLLGAAVSAVLLFAAPMASACALSAWTATNGAIIAGQPNDATPVSRLSGLCAARAAAIGDFVTDASPTGETTYQARFYYYTGNVTGARNVFEGRSAAGASNLPIRVQHNGTSLIFNTNGSATTATAPVSANRWYAVELAWAAGAGTGSLAITVTDAGTDTPSFTQTIGSVNNGSDTIEEARLGFISGTGTGAANFDAFDSRRTTTPGRLCRGDANNSGTRTGADATAVINEFVNGVLATGQPDANGNGQVVGSDASSIITAFLNTGSACP